MGQRAGRRIAGEAPSSPPLVAGIRAGVEWGNCRPPAAAYSEGGRWRPVRVGVPDPPVSGDDPRRSQPLPGVFGVGDSSAVRGLHRHGGRGGGGGFVEPAPAAPHGGVAPGAGGGAASRREKPSADSSGTADQREHGATRPRCIRCTEKYTSAGSCPTARPAFDPHAGGPAVAGPSPRAAEGNRPRRQAIPGNAARGEAGKQAQSAGRGSPIAVSCQGILTMG